MYAIRSYYAEHLTAHGGGANGHEERVALAPGKQHSSGVGQIAAQPVGGLLADRDEALLGAFAHDPQGRNNFV